MRNANRKGKNRQDNLLRKVLDRPRTVRVRPHSYQPSKAEKLENFRINATPEELADAVLRPVRVIEDPDA